MEYMFEGCESLINIDLDSINTQNVTNKEGMFNGCIKLGENKEENLNTIIFKNEEIIEKNKLNIESNKNIMEEKKEKNEKKENNFLLNTVSENLGELKDLIKDVYFSVICKECGNIFMKQIELGKFVPIKMLIENKILGNCEKCGKNNYDCDIPYYFNMKCKNCGTKVFEKDLPFSALQMVLVLKDNFKDCENCGKKDFILISERKNN